MALSWVFGYLFDESEFAYLYVYGWVRDTLAVYDRVVLPEKERLLHVENGRSNKPPSILQLISKSITTSNVTNIETTGIHKISKYLTWRPQTRYLRHRFCFEYSTK